MPGMLLKILQCTGPRNKELLGSKWWHWGWETLQVEDCPLTSSQRTFHLVLLPLSTGPTSAPSQSLGLAPFAPATSSIHWPFGVSILSHIEYKKKETILLSTKHAPVECLVFYVHYIYFPCHLTSPEKYRVVSYICEVGSISILPMRKPRLREVM